jgi:hypothetical protein
VRHEVGEPQRKVKEDFGVNERWAGWRVDLKRKVVLPLPSSMAHFPPLLFLNSLHDLSSAANDDLSSAANDSMASDFYSYRLA